MKIYIALLHKVIVFPENFSPTLDNLTLFQKYSNWESNYSLKELLTACWYMQVIMRGCMLHDFKRSLRSKGWQPHHYSICRGFCYRKREVSTLHLSRCLGKKYCNSCKLILYKQTPWRALDFQIQSGSCFLFQTKWIVLLGVSISGSGKNMGNP